MGVIESHLPDRPLEKDVAARNERPGLATVRRLVDTDSRFRVARGVRLARAGIERVSGRITRIHEQRADRVGAETVGKKLPVRARERLVGAPNTASRRGDVERALALGASRRDGHGRHAAARHVLRTVKEERIEYGWIGRLARTDQLPGAGRMRAGIQCRPTTAGRQSCVSRDLGLGVGPQQIGLDARRGIRAAGVRVIGKGLLVSEHR